MCSSRSENYEFLRRLQSQEESFLAPKAAHSAKSLGRFVPEEECPLRTCYQRDRDRILHSKAFRRLKNKTQVFLAPSDDHYRTRLTHTLEVAQIARTMARAISFNEDLTEAVALGHDLGHTPFGHSGEEVLAAICSHGFKHYLQSVRTVTYLEKGGKGLNLTREVLNGIACHTKGRAFTGEGILVRLADSIAYINHDIDDAIRAGMLREEELPSTLTDVLGHSKSQRITTLICSVVSRYARSVTGELSEIEFEPEVRRAHDDLKAFLFENVYTNPIAKSEERKAMALVEKLYKFFLDNPDRLPTKYQSILSNFDSHRAVCDYIASMTDSFAISLYTSLFVPNAFAAFQY